MATHAAMWKQLKCPIWPLSGLLALPACAGLPQLDVAPKVAAADWSIPTASPNDARSDDLATLLGSPELAHLIQSAQASSPALLAATARIDQARALVKLARGAALPSLSVGTNLTAYRNANPRGFDFSSNFASIDAALSIDIAGGNSARNRSASQRLAATGLDREALAVSLVSEIARTFVARATLHARVDLIDRGIADSIKLQRIIELRQQEGVATRVDVGLQAIRVHQLMAERDRLRQAFEETRVALALLVGAEAPVFESVPGTIEAFAVPDITPPPPSKLVAQRFDVRAAEARIASAGGDVAQARAAFFPQLDLSISRSASSFLTGGALSGLTLSAQLLAPIFDRHRLRGNFELATAQQHESVQNYRVTLLSALAQVENGLAAVRHARERAKFLLAEVEEAQRTTDLARRQYLEGDADLRHLLDAEAIQVSSQDAYLISREERLDAAIVMYRVSRG